MTPASLLTPEFVEAFPTPMKPAVLYVSIVYRTTGHLCCCGCGKEVIAPLAPAQWALTYDGDTVSLHPSIGNWALPCQSHYVIRRDQVLMRRRFTQDEVDDNRVRDRAALSRYDVEEVAALCDVESPAAAASVVSALGEATAQAPTAERESWWTRLRRRLRG
jgi:hypothetical protein